MAPSGAKGPSPGCWPSEGSRISSECRKLTVSAGIHAEGEERTWATSQMRGAEGHLGGMGTPPSPCFYILRCLPVVFFEEPFSLWGRRSPGLRHVCAFRDRGEHLSETTPASLAPPGRELPKVPPRRQARADARARRGLHRGVSLPEATCRGWGCWAGGGLASHAGDGADGRPRCARAPTCWAGGRSVSACCTNAHRWTGRRGLGALARGGREANGGCRVPPLLAPSLLPGNPGHLPRRQRKGARLL